MAINVPTRSLGQVSGAMTSSSKRCCPSSVIEHARGQEALNLFDLDQSVTFEPLRCCQETMPAA